MKTIIRIFVCIVMLFSLSVIAISCSNNESNDEYDSFTWNNGIASTSLIFAADTDIQKISKYFKTNGDYNDSEDCYIIETSTETSKLVYAKQLKYHEATQDFEIVVTQDNYSSLSAGYAQIQYLDSYGVSLSIHYGDSLNKAKYMGVYSRESVSLYSGNSENYVVKLTYKDMAFENESQLSTWSPLKVYDVQTAFVTASNMSKAKEHFDKEETSKKCYSLFNSGIGYMDSIFKKIDSNYSCSTQTIS